VGFISIGSRQAASTSRHGLRTPAAIAGLMLLASCSSSHTSQPATTSRHTAPNTTQQQASTTVPASATSNVTSSAPTATTTPTPTTAAPVALPTLGQLAGVFAKGNGFGQVKPSTIDNGGDSTGVVTHIVWNSWGDAQAKGTGTSDYVAAGQTVAQGSEEPVTVVAFNLGTCVGKVMYRAVEWYFPQHNQAFESKTYENICGGTYVGNP